MIVRTSAFQYLYGEHDRAVSAVHRYTAGELRKRLECEGLEPQRVTYANTLLFPAAVVWHWLHRRNRQQPQSDVRPLPWGLRWTNAWLVHALALEAAWLKRLPWGLPFGLSVIGIARKVPAPAVTSPVP